MSNNPFAEYQQNKVEKRKKIIEGYLGYLTKTRVQTKYLTDLADMVATHIALKEGVACNRATLLRNKKYKSLLLHYMACQHGDGTDAIDNFQIKDENAQALLLASDLESSNLRREVERLKVYISTLERKVDDLSRNSGVRPSDSRKSTLENQQLVQYADACKSLWLVLEYYKDIVSIDENSGCIIDLSRRRNNIVVDEQAATVFFEWLRRNKGIG